MIPDEELLKLQDQYSVWRDNTDSLPERKSGHKTPSQINVERVYTPGNMNETGNLGDLGLPGEFSLLQGLPSYRLPGTLMDHADVRWVRRPEETNQRFKYLLEQGQTGLSVAFDMPTLYGYDTDDPRAAGEFGKCGVAVSSLADMEVLFQGIPLDKITTSMTINSPAAIIWAMYIAVAQKQPVPMADLGGTIQNDILKEYIAQNEYIFPPAPSMRLVVDTVEYATQHLPKWNPISISGYHIRELGPLRCRSWLLPGRRL